MRIVFFMLSYCTCWITEYSLAGINQVYIDLVWWYYNIRGFLIVSFPIVRVKSLRNPFPICIMFHKNLNR